MSSAMFEPLSLSQSIVAILKRYGTVHIDFLARLVSRRRSEIQTYLDTLHQENIIEIDGEHVSLVDQESNKLRPVV